MWARQIIPIVIYCYLCKVRCITNNVILIENFVKRCDSTVVDKIRKKLKKIIIKLSINNYMQHIFVSSMQPFFGEFVLLLHRKDL